MNAVIAYILEKLPTLAGTLIFAAAVGIIVWSFSKLYHRFAYVEKGMDTFREEMKSGFVQADEKMKAEFVKTDEKISSLKTELKENDLFHLGKAMLIGFSESLKNNPERFERMKDTILETTPDNRKDEIKSITI